METDSQVSLRNDVSHTDPVPVTEAAITQCRSDGTLKDTFFVGTVRAFFQGAQPDSDMCLIDVPAQDDSQPRAIRFLGNGATYVDQVVTFRLTDDLHVTDLAISNESA
jgi:hypothetical protein